MLLTGQKQRVERVNFMDLVNDMIFFRYEICIRSVKRFGKKN